MKLALLVFGCGATLLAGMTAVYAAATSRVETTILQQRTTSWNDVAYTAYPKGQPQLTTVRITIPAHSALPWHTHVIPNAAYILSGQLTVEDRVSGRHMTYKAGEAFAESIGNVHRGFTGAAPAVIIVTYAGTPGAPLSIPQKGRAGIRPRGVVVTSSPQADR
jgi:quercetin dioxygenase-like cupin family protein